DVCSSDLAPTAFNQDISGWDVSSATDMSYMFVSGLESLAIGEDTSGTPYINFVYPENHRPGNFNHSLGGWDISQVVSSEGMLSGSGLSIENYDSTLEGWSLLTLQNGTVLGVHTLRYCDSEDARQQIIDDNSWSILGDELNCTPYVYIEDSEGPDNPNELVETGFG